MSQPQRKSVTDKRRAPSRQQATPGRPDNSSPRPSSRGQSRSRAPKRSRATYNAPHLWTKPLNKSENPFVAGAQNIVHVLLQVLLFIATGIMRGLSFCFGALLRLVQRSRIALVVVVIVSITLLGCAIDTGVNWGKIYPGVKIGVVDVGGKSVEAARAALEETYVPRLNSTTVTIYANDEARQLAEQHITDTTLQEQQSIDEVNAATTSWTTDARTLQAVYDAQSAAESALQIGREKGGVFTRIGAKLFGYVIEPRADYVPDSIELLAQGIDKSIGTPRVDFGVTVNNGLASVVDGHDGWMINRKTFENELNNALLQTAEASAHLVAHTEYAPLRIDKTAAQQTSDQINTALTPGADFTFGDEWWHASPETVGAWVETRIIEEDNTFMLAPFINQNKAKSALIANFKVTFDGEDLQLEFVKNEGNISVKTNSQETMPQVSGAAEQLNTMLFAQNPDGSVPQISIEETSIPATLSVDEALGYGLITCFSEYTTEYTAGAAARNHNIHLVADLLNNSIITANGGTWSFNDTAGNCNEQAGFQAAGSIVDGEYVDEIGGGICQVATTVFNAVYRAGFPVVERRNHSLYIASYPAGRDAAVSYPDLDLVWKNDSTSDVLLQMSYTDSTVVAKLYGVDPEYQVETAEGNWSTGAKFTTTTTEDDTMQEGTSYIKTSGTDGRQITVVRTVKDKTGAVLHEDVFESHYDPKNEVKVVGTMRKT